MATNLDQSTPRRRHDITTATPQPGLALFSHDILSTRRHRWVAVDTHSTCVRTRLWVAHRQALHRWHLTSQSPKAHCTMVAELCRRVDSCPHNNMVAEHCFAEPPAREHFTPVCSGSSGENNTTDHDGESLFARDHLGATEIHGSGQPRGRRLVSSRRTRKQSRCSVPLQSDFPECDYPRRVDELTLRAGKAEQLCTFIDATNVGTIRWGPPPCARRLACNLSGHPVGCRGSRGEEPVLQVCGDKQVAAAGHTCSGILSEKIEIRNGVRQDLWNRHLQNPALAVD